jgi:hypothetical protein
MVDGQETQPKETFQIDNPNLRFIFNKGRDKFPNKNYLEDGNPEMYSQENLQKREDLESNPIVDAAIENFIKDNFNLKQGTMCTKEDYLRVFSKCGSVLRHNGDPNQQQDDIAAILRDEFDQDCMERKKKKRTKTVNEEGEEEAPIENEKEEEQVVPSQPLEELPKEKLKSAIYELCDVWCPNIDAQDCADFLASLTERVKYTQGGH